MKDLSEPLTIVSAAATLPSPPTNYGAVPTWWRRDDAVVGEFDLDLWATATATLTDGELVAAIPHAFVYADNTIASVDHTVDELTETAHALKTGDGPLQFTTSGALPGGLALATDYWAIRTGANTFKVAASLADALAGTAVALSSNGTGTLTLVDTASTQRLWWSSYGALPTPIALDADRGFSTRVSHRQQAVAYGLIGTLSAGAISASVTPVLEL